MILPPPPIILWVAWASAMEPLEGWTGLLSLQVVFSFSRDTEHPVMVVAVFQKYKPQGTNTYSIFVWMTLADVSLAKASHVANLSITIEGDCTWRWTLRGMIHWGPLISQSTRLVSHSFTKYLLDSYCVPGILPGAWEQWWKRQTWFLPLSTCCWKEEKCASNGQCVENY